MRSVLAHILPVYLTRGGVATKIPQFGNFVQGCGRNVLLMPAFWSIEFIVGGDSGPAWLSVHGNSILVGMPGEREDAGARRSRWTGKMARPQATTNFQSLNQYKRAERYSRPKQ